MRNEKEYLKSLIKELERFFSLKLEDREKAALNLNYNWSFDCRDYSKIKNWQKKASNIPLEDNSRVSKATEEISSSLGILHHYKEDPKINDNYIKSILEKARKQLAKLEEK